MPMRGESYGTVGGGELLSGALESARQAIMNSRLNKQKEADYQASLVNGGDLGPDFKALGNSKVGADEAMKILASMPGESSPQISIGMLMRLAGIGTRAQQAAEDNVPAGSKEALEFLGLGVKGQNAKELLGAKGDLRGTAQMMRTVLSGPERNRYDSLVAATEIHNRMVDVLAAYNAAGGNPSVATKILQSAAARDPSASAVAQELGGNPAKYAAIYASLARQLGAEQFKLTTGSTAMPSDESIAHNVATYPTLGDSNDAAAEKFNTLLDTQIRPAMLGPQGVLELFKNRANGKYPDEMVQTVHDNLTGNLDKFGPKIHALPGYTQDANGSMNTDLTPPGQQAGAAIDPNLTAGATPLNPSPVPNPQAAGAGRKPLGDIFGGGQ